MKQIEKQKYDSKGFRGMLLQKIFKNLDTVMAVLLLFEQFLWQILFNIFAFNSESFSKYDTFCPHIFDLCVLGVRIIVIKEIEIMEKLYSSKITLKMVAGRDQCRAGAKGYQG